MKHLIVLVLLLSSTAFAKSLEAQIDDAIKVAANMSPAWKEYEAAALNREAKIGMPEVLFSKVRESWNCKENTTDLEGGRFKNQSVCANAHSKKPNVYQGKYFYTEGTIIIGKHGEKLLDGKLTAVQGQ